jgi:signal transduction histidine kinase
MTKPRRLSKLWPRSLQGQLLLAIALALLLAQSISAALLYRAQAERREAALIHTAAIRLVTAGRSGNASFMREHHHPPEMMGMARQLRIEQVDANPLRKGEARLAEAEDELRNILTDQGITIGEVVVVQRNWADDPNSLRRIARRAAILGHRAAPVPDHLMVAAVEQPAGGGWLMVRIPVPRTDRALIATLIGQTLLLYAVLVGAIALILGRMTRPLAALTRRVERFADTRDAAGQLEPQGPDDVRQLIIAHNALEARIAALIDEKDVMLGAIGHDLKTPLAALRVRIENVEDEGERARMAGTIEELARSLDDILSLARVGRPSDPREPTELSALVGAIVEEFEDTGDPVTLEQTERLVLSLRATWLRRALRNLIGNALRYGGIARVFLRREGSAAVIQIEDDGPGIPANDIARMLEPFTRGEPSRNSETGGAGLGLTLARAIAQQHGGTLDLANRRDAKGAIIGLAATLRLPIS